MARTAAAKRSPRKSIARRANPAQRYDANIDHILKAAAEVFAEKSFGLASIRDIAARARISFPRIYYYLRNKEEILFLISKRAFQELRRRANSRISAAPNPDAALRGFIESHLEYHMDNLAEMKVLVREADSLSSPYSGEIARLKRDYSRICGRLIDQAAARGGKSPDPERTRIQTSLIFGAMNWFYTWYDPARDSHRRARIIDEVHRMASAAIASR